MKGKKGIGKGKNPPIGQGPPRHHPPPPPSGRWSWEADDDDWGYDWGGGEAHHSEWRGEHAHHSEHGDDSFQVPVIGASSLKRARSAPYTVTATSCVVPFLAPHPHAPQAPQAPPFGGAPHAPQAPQAPPFGGAPQAPAAPREDDAVPDDSKEWYIVGRPHNSGGSTLFDYCALCGAFTQSGYHFDGKLHRHRRAHPHNWITVDQVADLQAQYIQEAADIDARLEKDAALAATGIAQPAAAIEQSIRIEDKEPVESPSIRIDGIEHYLAHFSAEVLQRLTMLEAAASGGQS